jgi:hypothetical protein
MLTPLFVLRYLEFIFNANICSTNYRAKGKSVNFKLHKIIDFEIFLKTYYVALLPYDG